ncbi:MAG: hypothetical protein HY895_21500 [Deltaproteobacteria bacterium]|nr:hypothetical protein [Deltaproteobacteria bacterium]
MEQNQSPILSQGVHLVICAGDFDYERAGAWLAGHDTAKLIRRHSSDPERIEDKAPVDPYAGG